MSIRFWSVREFPARGMFRLRQRGVTTMLHQELDGIAEELGEEHGTGVWSENVYAELVRRCREDARYLQRLRRAARAKAPDEKPAARQVRVVIRTLLDVIAEASAPARTEA